ncbi:hypothetical protein MRY82_08970 [bacterium]|nr:hypothetical protein [bacterium]
MYYIIMMRKGFIQSLVYIGLSMLLNACGLQVQQEIFSQSVESSQNAFKVHVNGLGLGEAVYLRYKLNIEGFDDNLVYDFPYDGEDFSQSDFSIVSSPCLKQCDLSYTPSSFANVLPELYIDCEQKNWQSIHGDTHDFISVPNSIAFKPSLDLNDNGEMAVLWREATGSSSAVYAHNKSILGWQDLNQQHLISPPDLPSQAVKVANNNNGKTLSVWQGLNNGIYRIYYSWYLANQTWQNVNDTHILSPANNHAFNPTLAINDHDEALVAWTQTNLNGINQVYFAEYVNGQWLHPASIDDSDYTLSTPDTYATDVQVQLNNDGHAMVSWRQINHLGEWQVFIAQRLNGQWLKPINSADHVSPVGSHVTGQPAIAMNTNGDVILAWSQINFSNNADRIFYAFRKNNIWQFPLNINEYIAGGEGIVSGKPSVSINDMGEIYIAWSQMHENSFNIYLAYKDELENWTYPLSPVEYIDQATDMESSYHVQVKVNQEGRALLAWSSYFGAISNVYVQGFFKKQQQGSYTQLSFIENSSAENVLLDFNDQCQAVVAWTQKDTNLDRQVHIKEMF